MAITGLIPWTPNQARNDSGVLRLRLCVVDFKQHKLYCKDTEPIRPVCLNEEWQPQVHLESTMDKQRLEDEGLSLYARAMGLWFQFVGLLAMWEPTGRILDKFRIGH